MRKLLIFVLSALCFSACNDYNIEEVLTGNTDISLSQKGKVVYTFNNAKGQAAYNPDRTLFRYCDDDLQGWFELKAQSRPGETGDVVVADLRWSTKSSSGNETGLEFTIQKTNDRGMIWMWNSSENIGLIIRDFE